MANTFGKKQTLSKHEADDSFVVFRCLLCVCSVSGFLFLLWVMLARLPFFVDVVVHFAVYFVYY